jgi:uncharacterized protein
MQGVVIDTNIVVSRYVYPKGINAELFEYWHRREIAVFVSQAILDEYEQVLAYPHIRAVHQMDDAQIQRVVARIQTFSSYVTPLVSIEAVQDDPKDNKFIECAYASGARYIISGDPHLLNLKQYKGISIVSPRMFLEMLKREERMK